MKEAPLVLIHGYPFDHTMWYATVAAMGSGIRVHLPDLPGFGQVPRLTDRPSIDAYADYIRERLKNEGVNRFVCAGMSMGGYVALSLAENHPDSVAGLGLISTQAAADTKEAREARMKMIAKIRAEGVQAALAALLPKLFPPGSKAESELAQFAIQGARKAGVEGLAWALAAMAERPDRTRFLRSYDSPTLLVHGSADKIVPFQTAKSLGDQLIDPIFTTISGAGHATPIEAPDAVADGLRKLVFRVREMESANVRRG